MRLNTHQGGRRYLAWRFPRLRAMVLGALFLTAPPSFAQQAASQPTSQPASRPAARRLHVLFSSDVFGRYAWPACRGSSAAGRGDLALDLRRQTY